MGGEKLPLVWRLEYSFQDCCFVILEYSMKRTEQLYIDERSYLDFILIFHLQFVPSSFVDGVDKSPGNLTES